MNLTVPFTKIPKNSGFAAVFVDCVDDDTHSFSLSLFSLSLNEYLLCAPFSITQATTAFWFTFKVCFLSRCLADFQVVWLFSRFCHYFAPSFLWESFSKFWFRHYFGPSSGWESDILPASAFVLAFTSWLSKLLLPCSLLVLSSFCSLLPFLSSLWFSVSLLHLLWHLICNAFHLNNM